MDSRDVDICKEIGQLLYDAAPAGSHSIVMRAQLADDDDQAKFEFDSVAENGDSSWFWVVLVLTVGYWNCWLSIVDFSSHKINQNGNCSSLLLMWIKENFHWN